MMRPRAEIEDVDALRADRETLRAALSDMLALYPDVETLDGLDDDLRSGKRKFPGDPATIRALKAWHALIAATEGASPTPAYATGGTLHDDDRDDDDQRAALLKARAPERSGGPA